MKDLSSRPALPASEAACPVTRAVGVIGGKWKLFIVYHLMGGTCRFGELQRRIPGITQQMLTAQLRELEADGILQRKVFAQVPPKVEYSLTPLGRELEALTDRLADWGQRLPDRGGGRAALPGADAGQGPDPGDIPPPGRRKAR